jgi:hypothetical protein
MRIVLKPRGTTHLIGRKQSQIEAPEIVGRTGRQHEGKEAHVGHYHISFSMLLQQYAHASDRNRISPYFVISFVGISFQH